MSREKPRSVSSVRDTPRSAAGSLYRSYRRDPPEQDIRKFLARNFLGWATHYLGTLFRRRHGFPVYDRGPKSRPGMIAMPDECVVALAGDWGTGTASAYAVADQIRSRQPDITIHLGDVYYSGTEKEYRDWFLGRDDWPRGRLRTFSLNGNHEMYSGGKGYFDRALPALGQATSYFCLEHARWRVLALDTGYYSALFKLTEALFRSRVRLHDDIKRWLRDVVFADAGDRRPVILLTHHQLFSAFESAYPAIGRDLAEYLDRVALWFWGHEHRFAGYAPHVFKGLPPVRARCIGHGGMPVEVSQRPGKRERSALVFHDARRAPGYAEPPIGYCGCAMLRFVNATLEVDYVDETGETLLRERWRVTPGGAVSGSVTALSTGLTVVHPEGPDALVQGAREE